MKVLRINDKRLVRGTLLLEIAAGFGALLIVTLLLLKSALAVTAIQRWTVTQSLTDAYMSREVAMGKRFPFQEFLGGGTLWPLFPAVAETTIEVGRLPGGRAIMGTLGRTRVASTNNLPAGQGLGDDVTNPTGVEMWQLQSYLTYEISGRTYVKSRTVVRAR